MRNRKVTTLLVAAGSIGLLSALTLPADADRPVRRCDTAAHTSYCRAGGDANATSSADCAACTCSAGQYSYGGRPCQNNIDIHTLYCQSAGDKIAFSTFDGLSCVCSQGHTSYGGRPCQNNIDDNTAFCKSAGDPAAFSALDGQSCVCSQGHASYNHGPCQVNLDDATRMCQSAGDPVAFSSFDGKSCVCGQGFTSSNDGPCRALPPSPVVPPDVMAKIAHDLATTGCLGWAMQGTSLTAVCPNMILGTSQRTTLPNAASCGGAIKNAAGALRCANRWIGAGPNYPTDFDIVSVIRDTAAGGIETKVWRVDMPIVSQPRPQFYPQITLRTGDRVSLDAGGCAQRGGHGNTWYRYVIPGNGQLYAGTAGITGVTAGADSRIAGMMGRTWTIANNNAQLSLGYQDDGYADNGYWGHDNGPDNTCAGVGPAWVEVTVESGVPLAAGPIWTPHSKPFDLVWDERDEDENQLPLRPQWAYQLDNSGHEPTFADPNNKNLSCGPAFSDGLTIDLTKLGQLCTSQMPTTDTHWALGGICDGWPLQGHLNWGIATYTGNLTFDWISGFDKYAGDYEDGAWDDDYNFELAPTDKNGAPINFGLTRAPGSATEADKFIVEFDPQESINRMGTQWWSQVQGYVYAGGGPNLTDNPTSLDSVFDNAGGGLPSVITGVFNLDAEHGAYTELHPVFAMAVRYASQFDASTKTQKDSWAFFLRNGGNEGGCASAGMHMWETPTSDYFVQVPWPAGATGVAQAGFANFSGWNWDEGNASTVSVDTLNGWVALRVHPRDGSTYFGVDGQFTVTYDVPSPGPPAHRAPVPRRARVAQTVDDLGGLVSRVQGPTRASMAAAFRSSQAALATPLPHKSSVGAPTAIHTTPRPHVPGAASRGVITRSRLLPPDALAARRQTASYDWLHTYQGQLGLSVPAAEPLGRVRRVP